MITITLDLNDYFKMYDALMDQIREEEKAACDLGAFRDYFSQDMSASHTQKATELRKIAEDLRAQQADYEYVTWERLCAASDRMAMQAAG